MEEVFDGDVNANNEHFRQVGFSKGVARVEELLVEMIQETNDKLKQESQNERRE